MNKVKLDNFLDDPQIWIVKQNVNTILYMYKYLTLYMIYEMNIHLKKETTINMKCMQRDAKVVTAKLE